jgi:hypothetical protein
LSRWSDARGSCHARLNFSQDLHQTNHVGLLEDAFDPIAIEISEGSFVE